MDEDQKIIVTTKGQLMAAVLAFSETVPTTIILKRKTGTTIIKHKWTGTIKKWKTEYRHGEGYKPVLVNEKAEYTLASVIKKIRTRIRKIPARELLA